MNKIVDRIYWVNDTDPALNETNLNQMDSELDALDDRVLALVGDCEAQAEEAEAWAVGERGGDPVSSGDPTYQNNSKYYAQQAAGSATTAGNSATAAGNSALAASGSATTAGNQALVSEGFANGTQNGTPVTSGSPYYENNAKYWKEQAQAIASQSLAGLTDVDINAPADGDILVYDSGDNEWKNQGNHAVTVTNNPVSITTQSAQVARDTKITMLPIQAAGTQTPQNPIPIYGYDSVDLTDCGKNILNIYGFEFGIWCGNDGTISSNVPEASLSDYIPMKPGSYVFSFDTTSNLDKFILTYYDADKNFIRRDATPVGYVFTAPTGTCYVRMGASIPVGQTITLANLVSMKLQLELGSTATTYEPYTPATDISLPLPSTVYGGEHDVERGVLKVTYKQVDMGDLNWTYNADARLTCGGFFGANITDGIDSDLGRLCSIYPLAEVVGLGNVVAQYGANVDKMMFVTSAAPCYIIDSDYTDGATFKTAVTGQKLVYKLATPYEIQLTPYEVNLLQGANVITSNGTSVTLTYREGTIATLEDIPSETVNKLAEMVADVQGDISTLDSTKTDLSAIAPIEDGATASQAYKVNEYFIRGGKLCKCISAISVGNTLTLNTNYAETTLAKEIPKYTVSTTDITPGVTPLPAGQFYIVLL